ncbi:MAG: fibronectin type III domain-containing protein, partial [Actinomycetes bacterium]
MEPQTSRATRFFSGALASFLVLTAMTPLASASTLSLDDPIALNDSSYNFSSMVDIASDGTNMWMLSGGGAVTEVNPVDGVPLKTLTGAALGLGTPHSIIYAGGLIWIADTEDDEIITLNPETGNVTHRYNAANLQLNSPIKIVASGANLYVANYYGNSVTVMKLSDGSLVRVVSGTSYHFDGPSGLAIESGRVWVGNGNGDSVTEFSAADGSLLHYLNAPSFGFSAPQALAVANGLVSVANYAGDSVTQITASSAQLSSVLKGSNFHLSGPSSINYANGALWVTNAANNVEAIDVSTSTSLGSYSGSSYHFDFPTAAAAIGGHVFVTNFGNSVTEFQPTAQTASVPPAPQSVSVVPSSHQLLVAWKSPLSNNGSLITKYTASVVGGGSCSATINSATYNEASCAITGLTNGQSYDVSVVATNNVGDGSATTTAATPATVPGAPTSVSGLPRPNGARISWTAPASNGGSAITSSTVSNIFGQGCTVIGSATSCTVGVDPYCPDGVDALCSVTSISNGIAYTFTVKSTNPAGEGPASDASAEVVPAALPDPPTTVTALAGQGSATISWSSSPSTGGSAITGFIATAAGGTATCEVAVTENVGGSCIISGLTNGSTYNFTVQSISLAGTGLASNPSNDVVPSSVPDAPTNLAATMTNGVAVVTWSPPQNNGGSVILNYVVSDGDSRTCTTVNGTIRTCSLYGFSAGASATITVVATNSWGPGAAASVVVQNPTAPSKVRNLATSLASGQITVTWDPPVSTGGSPILSYTVTNYVSTPCTVTTAQPRSCVFSGLQNGLQYVVAVVATNAIGDGEVESTLVTPSSPPSAPLSVTATPGDGRATIAFDPVLSGADGGATVDSYRVEMVGNNGVGCTYLVALDHGYTCTVSGLTNGVEVAFTVTAHNAAGTSGASLSVAVTPSSVPGAPRSVSAEPSASAAVVSWVAPVTNGGAAISGYTVTSTPGLKTCSWTSGPLSCTVAGLINGTSYTFTVLATNVSGDSSSSSPSSAVTPSTIPGAPTAVNAVKGNERATVSWTAPSSNGGSAVSTYTVTSTPDALTCTWTSGPLSCTVLGLTNGTRYTFSIVAHNTSGDGFPSVASSSVTPSTLAQAPTEVVATSGNARAIVSWTAPISNGGAEITSYTVTSSPGVKTCMWTSGPLSCTVLALNNGTSYTFTVVATNVNGNSTASAASLVVIPSTVPGSPTGVSAAKGDTQATVSWTAPSSNGGAAITGYTVTSSPGSKTCSWTSGPLSCTVLALNNGTSYTFTVVASNANGNSTASSPSLAVVPSTIPGSPTSASAVKGDGRALITWTAPSSNGGSVITSYTVTSTPESKTCTWTTGSFSCIVNGLTNGSSYTFTVVATNVNGSSSPSSATGAVTPSTVPGSPSGVSAVKGDTQATVSWTAPSSNGG